MWTVTQAALLLAASTVTGSVSADHSADAQGVLVAQVAAWNRGDLAAFCDVYLDDATFLSPSGITRGRQGVLDRYRKRYPDRAAMGTLALEPIEARAAPLPGRSGALAVSIAARWTLSYPDRPNATGLTLLVLHRVGARWRIVQDASFLAGPA